MLLANLASIFTNHLQTNYNVKATEKKITSQKKAVAHAFHSEQSNTENIT